MKNIGATLGVTAGCVLLAASAALAGNWPTNTYDCTYTVTTPQTTSTLRMASDGQGHMRTESGSGASSVISLTDYPNMVQTSLIVQSKMAMKSKMTAASAYVSEAESMKKQNAKSLGQKVVDGHPCHGWAYTTAGGKSEVWTADDIGCFVLSTTTAPAGKYVTELKSYSKNAPGKDAFQIPAGYKVMGN